MDNSLLVFEKYCKSDATKRMYQYHFDRFLRYCKKGEPLITADGLLTLKNVVLQTWIEDYVYGLRNKISPNSYSGVVASLQLFFSMNDIVLNWDKIHRLIPSSVAKSGKEAWTNNDIKKMLDSTTSLRNKAIIHLLASTGCRIGAISELRIKHLSNMAEGCMAVLLYADSKEEYYSYITPEAVSSLNAYLDQRKKNGEYFDEDSFVFREEYKLGIQKPKMLKYDAVSYTLYRIVRKIERKKGRGGRYNVQMAHGLRKRFASILKTNKDIPYSVGERLLGHQIYLDPSYFVASKESLFNFWKRVISDLTIDDSERERLRRIEVEQKVTELETEKDAKLAKLESENKEMKESIKGLWELMKKD
ncbi:MAG: site-specific integrase [Nitrosotalea sp.]